MPTSSSPRRPTRRPGKWRRTAGRALAYLAILAVVLAALFFLGIRTRSGRQLLLDWAGSMALSNWGVRVHARDFAIGLRDGIIEVDDVTLSVDEPGARPFLSLTHARAEWSWRSLAEDRVIVRSIRLINPVLDLSTRWPTPDEDRPRGGAPFESSSAFDAPQIELVDGVVRPAVGKADLELWLDSWGIRSIDARGSYVGGELDLERFSGQVRVDSRHRPRIELEFVAEHATFSRHSFLVDAIAIEGEGLALTASTYGDLRPFRPRMTRFNLDMAPARLFPDLTPAGHAAVAGELELFQAPDEAIRGAVQIDADGFPAALLEPWFPEPIRDELRVAGTLLAVDADLDVDFALDRAPGKRFEEAIGGRAAVVWRRQSERLLAASLDSSRAGQAIRVGVEAQILPDAPGRRRLAGTLVAPGWRDLIRGELQNARVELNEPDVATSVGSIAHSPTALSRWLPLGELEGVVEAEGPLLRPELRLDAGWRHAGRRIATAAARSSIGPEGSWEIGFEVSLLPDAPGARECAGDLLLPDWRRLEAGELRRSHLTLELPDLAETIADLERLRADGALAEWMIPEAVEPILSEDRLLTGELIAAAEVSGALTAPELSVDASWNPASNESVELQVRGHPVVAAPYLSGPARVSLAVQNLDLTRLPLDLEIPAGLTRLERLHLEARTDGNVVDVTTLSGAIANDAAATRTRRFDATGSFSLEIPLRSARAQIAIDDPIEPVDHLEIALRLEGGTVHVEPLRVEYADYVATVTSTIPLEAGSGPVVLSVSDLAVGPFLPHLAGEEAPRLEATLDGSVSLDPADLTRSTGVVEISRLSFDVDDEPVEAAETLRLELRDGRVVLAPVSLPVAGSVVRQRTPLDLTGSVDLRPGWARDDGFGALVTGLSVELRSTFDASMLNPFLPGGVAAGHVTVDAGAEGPLESLVARADLRGPEASLLYRSPYPTRLEAPEIDLRIAGGEAVLETGRATLNNGSLELSGVVWGHDGLNLRAEFKDVRFRLDFGLTAIFAGDLRLEWDPGGRHRLSGDLVVQRAVLRRDILLDREILGAVFDPPRSATTDRVLDTVILDVIISTDEGLSVKNNLAELHADWGQVQLSGTLADPLLSGRVEIDPGGIVQVIGQTVRIDEGSLGWSADVPSQPRFDLETTSSAEDPTIKQDWRTHGLGDQGPGQGGALDFWGRDTSAYSWESMAAGAMTYYQNRLFGAVTSSAVRTELSYEPLPLFGETNTQARFTLAQHFTPNITYIFSSDPRQGEATTNIIDLHRMAFAPSFRLQLFSNDRSNEGATLQQTLKLGGKTRLRAGRRLGSVLIDAPEGVRKRRVRRAIGFRKGDPFQTGAKLDVEVDTMEALRKEGYPEAGVVVDSEVSPTERVDLIVTVAPGVRTEIVFEGTKLPRSARRAIGARYRPGAEEASIEAMSLEALLTLRSLGYLEPEVEISIGPSPHDDSEGDRTVRVSSLGGRKIDPGPPAISGVPPEVAEQLAAGFVSRLARVELAAGTAGADEHLVGFMARLGYPQGRIVSRQLSEDGHELSVEVEPGPRERLVSVAYHGIDAKQKRELAEYAPLLRGDPAQRQEVLEMAHKMEDHLRDQGHAEARVRATLEPVAEDRPFELRLRFDIDAGPLYDIESVEFEGLRAARPSWIARTAKLETGDAYSRNGIAEARARLFRTGVFRQIRVTTEAEGDPKRKKVNFDLIEGSRYRLSYGGRWESDLGFGAVIDFADTNSLGRGQLTGVRLVYGSNKKSLRLYHRIPRIIGPKSSFEAFLEGTDESGVIENTDVQGIQAWFQLTFPISPSISHRAYTVFERRDVTVSGQLDDLSSDQVASPRFGYQVAIDTRESALGGPGRKGAFLGFDLSGTTRALGSDLSAVGGFSQFRVFVPFRRSKKWNWAQSYRAGFQEAFAGEIPFADRLRAGGQFSVRGYTSNSLGPLSPDGTPLGGEILLIINQELHFPVRNGLRGVLFVDGGNVWFSRKTLDANLFKSAGLGARYASPIGPLRLDVAWPLNRRDIDPDYKIYLGFANVF